MISRIGIILTDLRSSKTCKIAFRAYHVDCMIDPTMSMESPSSGESETLEPLQVLLYYNYTPITDAESFSVEHKEFCDALGLRGRILIGDEGINGTVSGTESACQAYMDWFADDGRFKDTEFKIDPTDEHLFPKLSVRYRREIVALGLGEEDLHPREITGRHLSPVEWRETLKKGSPGKDYVLLDVRNDYESDLGHFRGALKPPLNNFRDFPEWVRENLADKKEKKILTYCTGGIRCEKFSGFLRQEGFEDVAQLHGGIIEYGKDEETKGELFDGLCYVFDKRISVEVNRTEDKCVVSRCAVTGEPSVRYVNCALFSCNGRMILSEEGEAQFGRFCSEACKARAAAGERASAEVPGESGAPEFDDR